VRGAAPPFPEPQLQLLPTDQTAAVGLAVGMFIAGFLFGLLLRARQAAIGNLILSGDALALVYNPTDDTLSLIPVTQVAEGLYMGKDGRATLMVPRPVTAMALRPLRKPCFLSVGLGWGALAVDPRALSAIGVASLALKTRLGQAFEAGGDGGGKLVSALLEVGSEASGEVEINPDFRLALAYNVPTVVKEYLATMVEAAEASVQSVLNTMRASERIHRMWLERERARPAMIEALGRAIVFIILAAGMAFFLLFLLGRMGG